MLAHKTNPSVLEQNVERLRAGDPQAAEWLIEHAYCRLQQMAARMLRSFPSVRRWEDTDDVWLVAATKFHRALVKSPPESVQHFFNLAGTQIRWTLIELARKHNGPLGLNSNHDTHHWHDYRDGTAWRTSEPSDNTDDPLSLSDWTEFHCDVERLPDGAREVFDLLWYGGLTPEETARVLGLHIRSIKRRWRQARLLLYQRRHGSEPQ